MSLAYWGSKKRLAADIADALCADAPRRPFVYYEPFCGMASVGMELLRRGDCTSQQHWSDADADVVAYWQHVKRGWLPPTRPVSQAEYERMRRTTLARRKRSDRRSASPPTHVFYGLQVGWGGHMFLGRSPAASINKRSHLERVRERVRGRRAPARGGRGAPRRAALLRDADARARRRRLLRPAVRARRRQGGAPPLLGRRHGGLLGVRAPLGRGARLPRLPVGVGAAGGAARLRATVVRRWTVMNRSATGNAGPKARAELLVRVTAA